MSDSSDQVDVSPADGGSVRRRAGQKYLVAKTSDLPPGGRVIVRAHGRSYGVFNIDGCYRALLNRCPHQGAELCKGPLRSLVVADAPGQVRFDPARWFIQCPWHGWEFDVQSGRAYADPNGSRVRSYPVDVEPGCSVNVGASRERERLAAVREPLVDGGVQGSVVSAPAAEELAAETIDVVVEDEYVVLILPR